MKSRYIKSLILLFLRYRKKIEWTIMKKWTIEEIDKFQSQILNYPKEELRLLPTGELIVLHKLAYTWSVCIGGDKVSLFTYRFCFANYSDAKRFFEEIKDPYEVPDYGWCAARPESRILLPRDLISYVDPEKRDLLGELNSIDYYINLGIYTKKEFNRWMEDTGAELDKGVQEFYKGLPDE